MRVPLLFLLGVVAAGCASTARGADVPDVREAIDATPADATTIDATDASTDCGALGCDDTGPWVRRFAGEGPSGALQSATDRSGNLFVAGSGSFASYAPDGTQRWSRYIAGAAFLDVAVGRDGNVYASGVLVGPADFGGGPIMVSAYRRNPFVASFTSVGVYRWAHAFGETGRDVGARVAVDDAGNVFVTGNFASTLDFGGGPVESVGFDYNVYVASYAAGGDFRWSRRFDRGALGGGPTVSADATGNVYVAGGYLGSISFDGTTIGAGDASGSFVASFSNSGSTRWAHDLGAWRTMGLAVTRDGTTNVVAGTTLTRYTSDGTMRDTRALTGYAGFPAVDDASNLYLVTGGNVVSYTDAGDVRWMRPYPSTSEPSGYATLGDLTADGSGAVYLTASYVGRANFGSGELVGNGDALVSFATDGTPRWSRRFGSGWDRAHSVAVHDDDVFIAGTFTDRTNFGTSELATLNDGEIYLASFTRAGSSRWSRQFGGVSNFRNRHQVATDREGNVYLAGVFAATVDFGGGPITSTIDPLFTGEDDVYLASFTRDGAHRWSRRIGSTYHARTVGLAVGASGELYVAYGSTLERYDTADCTQRWSHVFMGPRSDRGAPRLAIDGAGNVYFTGVSVGTLDFGGGPLMSAGLSDVFVASFTPDGAHRWSTLIGETNEDLGGTVAVDESHVYVAAYFRGVPQFGGPSIPGSATVLRSYSRDGVMQWSHRFDGVGGANDGPNVAVDPRGGVYLTGQYQGAVDFGSGASMASGFTDAFVAGFDGSGVLRDVRTFRANGFSAANGIATDARGGTYVTGSFSGSVDFGVGRLSSESVRDIFLARLAP